MRTSDHLFSDPNADELVLRHRLHSSASLVSQSSMTSPNRRPALGLGVSSGTETRRRHWMLITFCANWFFRELLSIVCVMRLEREYSKGITD